MKFLVLTLTLLSTCTKKLEYSKSELWELAREEDPNIRLVLPSSMNEGIKCSDYGPGCQTGFTVQIGVLKALIIQFDNMQNARNEAKRIDQYYKYNWIFDDVAGEPLLERFVEKVYGAVRPLKHKATTGIKKVKSM
jgi:hypothetical protein